MKIRNSERKQCMETKSTDNKNVYIHIYNNTK